MSLILNITDANFETEIARNPRPTVILFHATWSGPARMSSVLTTELAQPFADVLNFASINVDQNPQTTASYGISSLPTFIVLRAGLVADRLAGPVSRTALQSFLENAQAICT